MSAAKSLGQIAYETVCTSQHVDTPIPWANLPSGLRRTYVNVAKAVVREVVRRRKAKEAHG